MWSTGIHRWPRRVEDELRGPALDDPEGGREVLPWVSCKERMAPSKELTF